MPTTLDELKQLPVPERIQLVEDLWDSLPQQDANVPLTEAQLAELDRRRAEMIADPSIGIPWDEAKARLLNAQP